MNAHPPISNPAWSLHTDTQTFVAEISELRGTRLDPWNQNIPTNAVSIRRNTDNEVEAWQGTVTIGNLPAQLCILND